ncbi:7167_t:CDS:1, partial [Racocetra fulgida]
PKPSKPPESPPTSPSSHNTPLPTPPPSHNTPLPTPPPSNNTPPPTPPPSNNTPPSTPSPSNNTPPSTPSPFNNMLSPSDDDHVFVNSDDLYDLLNDLYSEGIKPDANARDLYQDEKNFLEHLFEKEHSLFKLNILTATSSMPCPYENTLGHYCHMGCIVRHKNAY